MIKTLRGMGNLLMENNLYLDQINEIRKRGGDVIVFFGGEGGTEKHPG